MFKQGEKLRTVYLLMDMALVTAVFVVEVLAAILMKSQNLIESSIIRYSLHFVIAPTLLNILGVIIAYSIYRHVKAEKVKNAIPIILLVYVCGVVCTVHYVFSNLLLAYLLPIFMCTVFESYTLLKITAGLSIVAQIVSVIWEYTGARIMFEVDLYYAIPRFLVSVAAILVAYILASILLKLFIEKKDAEIEEQKRIKSERMSFQMMTALAGTIDAKDPYTNGHSSRVSMYAREIAKRAGYDEAFQQNIYFVALLHDIGKIGIPDNILGKTGKLTDEEYEIIKLHTTIGAEILSEITEIPKVAVGAKYHHERFDGNGYPDGLSGTDIPLVARIICVADAYDAMSSDRSYRKALSQETILKEIDKGRGTQFDPKFSDIMEDLIRSDKEYNMRGGTEEDLMGIVQLRLLFGEESDDGAFNTSIGGFGELYHFLRRYAKRNNIKMQLMVITLRCKDEKKDSDGILEEEHMWTLRNIVSSTVRKTDVATRLSRNQFIIILTDMNNEYVDIATNRITEAWNNDDNNNEFELTFESQEINSEIQGDM
jgi:putative nucleotidyltransferase with HDIG domain